MIFPDILWSKQFWHTEAILDNHRIKYTFFSFYNPIFTEMIGDLKSHDSHGCLKIYIRKWCRKLLSFCAKSSVIGLKWICRPDKGLSKKHFSDMKAPRGVGFFHCIPKAKVRSLIAKEEKNNNFWLILHRFSGKKIPKSNFENFWCNSQLENVLKH